MKFKAILLFAKLLACISLFSQAPSGFVPLFNGIDLEGWWGLKTEDPEKWMALPQKDFKAKWKASLLDVAKNWTV